MKKLYFLLSFLLITQFSFAATYYAVSSGNWTPGTAATRFSTTSCAGAATSQNPGQNDILYVCSGVTLTIRSDISVKGNPGVTQLIIDGTVDMNGNSVTVTNAGTFTINAGGTFKNASQLQLNNNVSITVNGALGTPAAPIGQISYGNSGSSIVGTNTGTSSVYATTLSLSGGLIFGHTSSGCSPCVLPIELTSFTAMVKDIVVFVNWTTKSEVNNNFFTIERSTNGVDFEAVGLVQGAGNSTKQIDYEYQDDGPVKGIDYYRLKQTDFDGKFTYSDLQKVNYNPAEGTAKTLTVYPNPANEKNFHIKYHNGGFDEEVLILVRDASGKEIFLKTIVSVDEQTIHASEIQNTLPAGIYFITASSDGHIINHRLIVQ